MKKWPLVPAKNQGRYDDLIFVPFDLPLVPQVDVSQFLMWMKANQNFPTMRPKSAFEKTSGKEYPWFSSALFGDITPLREAFPEISQYVDLFPLKKVEQLVFLAQRGHQDVFKHTDSDGLYGMRFYLTKKNAEGLHFYRGREKYDYFPTYATPETFQPTTGFGICPADWDHFFKTEEPVYATFPSECSAFHLNSARAVHAVDANTCELGERIAVLVIGELDHDKRDQLIERSLDRYGQHAIWY